MKLKYLFLILIYLKWIKSFQRPSIQCKNDNNYNSQKEKNKIYIKKDI